MPEQVTHPSHTDLHAYGLGQLPPDEATAIERHISECEPCCETIAELSSADTFIELLQNAEQEPNAQTADHPSDISSPNSAGVPEPLAKHPRYEIVGLIGKGGMGDVYKATHRMMDRTVALKIIKRELMQNSQAVDRFHREVKAAAKLSHPNIVTSHDAEQAGDVHFLVMEYVDGVNLSQIVKDQGALAVAEACDYIRQVSIGLQHAHERGMVHRDIKPHNLMVTKDGTVKVLDFGLASLAPETVFGPETNEGCGDLTAAGAIMGTPDFISPEQADDARTADIRSDIYSLGATLYFLLSGQAPFSEGSVMSKLKSHAQSDPAPLSSVRLDVPAELADIIARMMAKDPEERFKTPEELAEALKPFSRSTESEHLVELPAQSERRRSKSPFVSPTAVSVAFVAIILAGTMYFVQTNNGGSHIAMTPQEDSSTLGTHRLTIVDTSGKKPLGGTSGTRQNDATGITTHFFESANGRYKVELVGKVLKVNGDSYSLKQPNDEIRIVDDRVEITHVAVRKVEGEARRILDRMLKAYAECKSYRDSGIIKSRFFENRVSPEFTVEHSFATAFVRPDRIRFEISDEDAEIFLLATNGQKVQTRSGIEPGFEKPESLDSMEFAMVQAIGFSGADVGRVPGMLIPQRLEGWTELEIIEPNQIGDGTLRNVECFRLEYRFRDEHVILWIDKQTFLVRQINEHLKLNGMRVERTTTFDPTMDGTITDEMLEFDPPSGRANGDAPTSAPELDPISSGGNGGEERTFSKLGLKFCWCPPGQFTMGRPKDEPGRTERDNLVDVTLTDGLWMGKFEVTQRQWMAVMGSRPWEGNSSINVGPDFPAAMMTWGEASSFCEKLTSQERGLGRLPDGWLYILPTDAQWEYACRAGTKTRYSYGDDQTQWDRFGWGVGTGDGWPHSVGTKLPNPWNLHDMYGNMGEWCRDWYQRKLPGGINPVVARPTERLHSTPSTEPQPFTVTGPARVYRVGSSFHSAQFPDQRYELIGFRVALVQQSTE